MTRPSRRVARARRFREPVPDGSAGSEVVQERADEELLLMLDALREPDLGERSGSEKTAMQHGPSASPHPDISGLQNFEGE